MKKLILVTILIAFAMSCFCAEKYAVLIAPDRPLEHRELQAVWNDMVLMYKLLMSKGFSESNIYVLHADGTDFPGIDNYYSYPIVNE